MAIILTISGVDKTKKIAAGTLRIDNEINSRADTCSFEIMTTTTTDRPALGREVIITNGGTRVFAGNVVKVTDTSLSFLLLRYEVECIDYTRFLDRKLVPDSYENMTIAEIIEDIVDNYVDTGDVQTGNLISEWKMDDYEIGRAHV